MNSINLSLVALLVLVIACGDHAGSRIGKPSPVDPKDDSRGKNRESDDGEKVGEEAGSGLSETGDPTRKTCSIESGRRYRGFGDTDLVAGRVTEVPIEMDRFRIKPLDVLSADLARVIGSVPPSLERNRSTFIEASPRWFIEPKSSGVTIYSTYRIAYEGGLTYAASNQLTAAAPTEATATEVCRSFAQTAWKQAATDEQVSACARIAVVDTAAEPDVRARWAYALASILTSTEFINY